MKKFYFYLLISTLAFQFSKAQLTLTKTANEQLTLTKTANEPIVGDIFTKKTYDSTIILPRNTGALQSWDLTTLTLKSTDVTTFSTATSAPSSSTFPSASLSEKDISGNNYKMWKTSGASYELVGFSNPPVALSLSNTAIAATWPVGFGYSNSDTFSGSAMVGTTSISFTGTITVTALGSGTVVLPGNFSYPNCLQSITSTTIVTNFGGVITNENEVTYTYYHASQKFDIASYGVKVSTTGTTVTRSFDAHVNNAVFTNIKENGNINSLSISPNPAKNYFDLKLTNEGGNRIYYELVNIIGQTVRKDDLGSDKNINARINTEDLQTGIYFARVKVGESTITRKIVIE